jgi:RND family efflux transporter MFP subunit
VIQRKINLLTYKIALDDAKAKHDANPSDKLLSAYYELAREKYSNLLDYDVSVITAELAKEDAQTALETAQANLAKTVLAAPIDGIVSSVNYKVGETVTVNTQSVFGNGGTSFLTLVDPTVVYVTSSVTEGDIAGVKIGQTMKMSIDAASLANIEGVVTDIQSAPNIASSGIVTYTVTGRLSDPDVSVLEGMSVVITFIKSEKSGILLIPVKAVTTDADGIQTVNAKKADGTIEKRTVETGLSNGVSVEVVSGLSEGETVVIGSVAK